MARYLNWLNFFPFITHILSNFDLIVLLTLLYVGTLLRACCHAKVHSFHESFICNVWFEYIFYLCSLGCTLLKWESNFFKWIEEFGLGCIFLFKKDSIKKFLYVKLNSYIYVFEYNRIIYTLIFYSFSISR